MAQMTIYRGSHQIGGCCTEFSTERGRILIDFGENLPNSDKTAPIKNKELVDRVFGGRPADGVLFTHYHGDHYGLFKEIPENTPMYIGPLARDILQILTSYTDRGMEEKRQPLVESMRTYKSREWMQPQPSPGIDVKPLYVDHSALDAYMFCISIAGKNILFTGDFREHGIVGENDRLWRTLKAYAPKNIDLLVTEGTMLSRVGEEAHGLVRTERELGARAAELFGWHKYNFVLVSSTNLDSIMEFYRNTPRQMHFVCDVYQAEIIVAAMKGMKDKGGYSQYQTSGKHQELWVLGRPDERWKRCEQIAASLEIPLKIQPVSWPELERDGFVLLARKNRFPEKKSAFEKLRDRYFDRDGQIIYSMWKGYLEKGKTYTDPALLSYIGNRPYEPLHTSGHAYVETIAKLIREMNPKVIVPMHTERADEFATIPAFAPYRDRILVCQDGVPLDLDKL